MKTYTSYYGSASDTPVAYGAGDIARIINNTQTDNLNWALEEVNQATRYLVTKYYFNERTFTTTTGTQVQFYNLPPQVKKIINMTVTIGGVKWQPIETATRQQWDRLNVINFYQDYPSNFFVFNGQVGLFPIPASGGNTITINYKTRIQDLSMADVSNGTQTMAVTNGSTALLASGTTVTFSKWMQDSGWIRLPHNATDSLNGDNQWYQISSVTSGTQAVLTSSYTGQTVSGAAFTIGDVSILPEDYQDLPLYRMAQVYYTTRFPDATRAQLYQGLWDRGVAALDEEFGSKTTSILLSEVDAPTVNPNLFQRSIS